jgi:two-component system chemotaxis response regulator CheB
LGIILTGLGTDGLDGIRAIKTAGGRTIAQDAAAIEFGMTQAVINENLADCVSKMDGIPAAMMNWTAERSV